MEKYAPPFVLTNEMLEYVSSIMEKIGSISSFDNLSKFPMLRKQNRIKSIQSSCAIEANSLSLDQVEDVINGRKVFGPAKDILEIKNSIKAYDIAFDKNPFSETALKSIHLIMTISRKFCCLKNGGNWLPKEDGKKCGVSFGCS